MKQFLITFLLSVLVVLAVVAVAALGGCCQPDPCGQDRERAERSAPYHQPQK
jgi:hypothetical protein